jgi:hypothetical protein
MGFPDMSEIIFQPFLPLTGFAAAAHSESAKGAAARPHDDDEWNL